MLGVPHAWPSPDPIVQDLETYKIAAEQPYIYRLTDLGRAALRTRLEDTYGIAPYDKKTGGKGFNMRTIMLGSRNHLSIVVAKDSNGTPGEF